MNVVYRNVQHNKCYVHCRLVVLENGLWALLISDLDGQDQSSFVDEVHSDTEEESDGSEASGMFLVDW